MYLKRSVISGLFGAMLLASTCTAAQETKHDEKAASKQSPKQEMVEIKIRMPDGRVIVRKEPKSPSRFDSNHPIMRDGRPAVVNKSTKTDDDGNVNILDSGVTGGSNSAPSMGSGGASGGSSSRSRHSGGGGSSDTNRSNDSGDSDDSSIAFYTPPQSVMPDNDYTVRLFAWENSGPEFNQVIKTYIADPRSKSPSQLAQRIADNIAIDQPEKIAIRFWKEFDPASRDPFDQSSPRELISSGGYTIGLTEYWNSFANELASRGVRPDYLIFDQEQGIGFWNIPTPDRHEFFDELLDPNRTLSANLPISMRSVTVNQFMNYHNPQGTIALNDYNQFAAEFRARLLKNVFSDAFQTAFNQYIYISNYKDYNPSFETLHHSNRPQQGATTGGISAPVAYLDLRNDNPPRYVGTEKTQRWNRLIDALNSARSSASTGLVTPWISAPGYGTYGANSWARPTELAGEYRIWDIMMDHMLAMGIDTFILWNPGPRFNPNAQVTDAYVDQWLAQHPQGAGAQLRDLPEIELDADEFTTNGVTTTYQDFLDAINNE